MSITIEKILTEINELPNSSKVIIAEKIIESIDENRSLDIEAAQLEVAKNRRDEILLGRAITIDGETALQEARNILDEI